MISITLTQGLMAVGGLVLVGVVVQGVWAARKASPRQADMLPGRTEPQMHGGLHTTQGGTTAAGPPGWQDGALAGPAAPGLPAEQGAFGQFGPLDTTTPLGDLRPITPRKTARLDPLIDAIASLRLDAPVSGDLALAHLPPSRRAGTKPFLIEGLNAATNDWELPAAGQRYSEFQAGVQLANRSGALDQIEYSEFVQKLQGFADGVGAMPDLPDMQDAVARGRELDAFASDHDAQLSLTLRANGAAWSLGYLQQCAGRHGFVPGALPGRLVMPGAEDGSPAVLVLAFDQQAALADNPGATSVREAHLSLDVPQTTEAGEPFPAWHEAARLLAAEMDAEMIDGAGRPITLHAFAAIGTDLAQLYSALAQRDLAAGSAAARRLFS